MTANPFKARVNKPFPLELALFMRDISGIDTFVETGTYRGDTARLCSRYFRWVYTIEGVSERYKELAPQVWPINVGLLYGDSAIQFPRMLHAFNDRNVIAWLDAHWFHNGSPIEDDPLAGGLSPCPLLAELKALGDDDFVIIDDALFFLTPPKSRQLVEDWPTISDIVKALPYNHYVFLYRETLAAVPEKYKRQMIAWLHEHEDNTRQTIVYMADNEYKFSPSKWENEIRGRS